MVRIAAGSCLALGVLVFTAYLTWLGKSPLASSEIRHLREMKDRRAVPASAAPLTLAGFYALPASHTVAEYASVERRAVVMEGWVWRMERASDGDIHLSLGVGPHVAGREPEWVTAEITPGWRLAGESGGVDPAAGWSYGHLVSVFRPDRGGVTPWDDGPARVRLTGWLLYDREVEERHPWLAGEYRPHSKWEIHPVTRIERRDDSRAVWVEVAR